MKSSILVFLSIIVFSFCVEDNEFPIENSITVLTTDTFDKALAKYDYMLVMFYAPWCGHCKKFKPELEKAAAVLRKENYIVAKVDATVERKLTSKYKVRGYPTVIFFKKGIQIEYSAGRKEEDVINWVRKKAGPPAKELTTAKDVEDFQKENPLCGIFFGQNAENIKAVENVGITIDDYPFGLVKDDAVARKFNAKQNSFVLFKPFDENRNDLENISEQNLRDFLNKYSTKRVAEFDDKITEIVFGKNQPALVYFGEKGDKWNEVEKLLDPIAVKVAGKLKVVMTEIKSGMGKRVAEYIGLEQKELPAIRILDTRKDLKKFNMEGNIDEKTILEFVEGWETGKIKPFLKSQEEPKENNGPVFVVVGKTYEKEVINNDKDVMVVFYSDNAISKNFLRKYQEAANKLKSKNPNLVMAKIDGIENEVESVDPNKFPTIKFYPGNLKNRRPLDYNGEKTADGVIKFLQEKAYHKIVLEEEQKEGKTGDL
jgi:protein disulfide-isomerase A1